MAQGKTGAAVFTKTDSNGTRSMRVSWSETYSGNTSTISITGVEFQTNGYLGYTYNSAFEIRVNGTTAISITEGNGWKVYSAGSNYKYVQLKNDDNTYTNLTSSTVPSGRGTGTTVSVPHNANGTATIAISIHHTNWTYPGFWTQYLDGGFNMYWVDVPMPFTDGDSQSFSLTTVPLGTLSISAGEHSYVTVNRTATTYATTGQIYNGYSLYYGDRLQVSFGADTNYGVTTHTVNGSTFTSGGYYPSASGTITSLTNGTLPIVSAAQALASSVAATSANIGSQSTITITRYGPATYGHSLQYSFGSSSGYITGTGGISQSEVKFVTSTTPATINWTIPTTFYEQITNAKTGTCTITCRTYQSTTSTTQLGSSTTATLTVTVPSTMAPTVSGTVTDSNPTTAALTDDSNKLVRYMSTALCTISATGKQSASITAKSINGTAITGNTKSYTNVTATSFTFSATDSRGYTSTATVSPTIVAYVPLTINATVSRPSPTGSTLRFDFSGNYFNSSFGSQSNTLTVSYRSKLQSESWGSQSWTTISRGSSSYQLNGNGYSTVSAGYTTAANFPYTNSYDLQIKAVDKLITVTQDLSISRGVPIFDWGSSDFEFNVDVIGPVLGLGRSWERIENGNSYGTGWDDFNSYTYPGVYGVTQNSVAQVLRNPPTTASSMKAGVLRVWNATGTPSAHTGTNWYYLVQEYTDIESHTWKRYASSSNTPTITFYSWRFVYDSANKPTPADIGAATSSHTHSQYYDSTISRTANTVLAAPNGSAGGATFRKLVAADLPTVTIAKGGTGKTNAADALANLGGISKKLLWTNSSPTSSMAGQTIPITDVSTYSEFEVYFMMSTSTQYAEARFFLYDVQGRAQMAGTSNGYVRDVKFTSSGMVITTGTSSSYVIPYKIYGIKGLT